MRPRPLLLAAGAASALVATSAIVLSLRSSLPSEAANNLTILYITTDPLSSPIPNSTFTHAEVASALGALTPNTPDEAASILRSRPVDAIVVDHSALGQVDRATLQRAYTDGAPIVAVNISAADLAMLVDDHCISRDPVGQPFSDSGRAFYILAYRRITASNPSDAALLLFSEQRYCGDQPPEGIPGEAYVFRGTSIRELTEGGPLTLLELVKSSVPEQRSRQP